MNVLSLFSGVGGIDLGLERLGCKTIGHSEIDPYSRKVMAVRFPESADLGNITTLEMTLDEDGQDIAVKQKETEQAWVLPAPDIVCGGFPCQDVSAAWAGPGVRGGERSGLWREYARIVGSVRPRIVLVENVPNLSRRGLDIVLGDLATLGYDAEWDCVPASAVGASHERFRMFIVAYPNSAGLEEQRRAGTDAQEYPAAQRNGSVLAARKTSHPTVEARVWPSPISDPRAFESRLDRVTDRLSHRVDRLRCLGNAVVPQVAEHVGRIALSRMSERVKKV